MASFMPFVMSISRKIAISDICVVATLLAPGSILVAFGRVHQLQCCIQSFPITCCSSLFLSSLSVFRSSKAQHRYCYGMKYYLKTKSFKYCFGLR